jgi:ABC-type branched-subunit amino acid transport system substrate-binding protein
MADGDCPYSGGPRRSREMIGPYRYFAERFPGLHGMHVLPADLPSTLRAGLVDERAADAAGIVNEGDTRLATRDDEIAYARFAEALAERGSTYVGTVANDRTMLALRRAAAARGVTTVSVWSCGMGCYTKELLDEGAELVEGTYVWLPFLPFDEADHSRELAAYLDAIGGVDNATPWGATAWAAAAELGEVVTRLAERDGPNAITRARVLAGLAALADFDADGWFAPRGQRELSPCFVLLQVRNGEFTRVFPAERGTFSCDPANLVEVAVDPAADGTG